MSVSIIQRVGKNCSSLASKEFLTVEDQTVEHVTMSKLTNIQFSVRILLLLKKFKKIQSSGHKHFSTIINKFSTAIPHPLVMILTGFLLYVL